MSLILGTSNSDYHANSTHLSSSGLKTLLKDPAEFYNDYVLGNRISIEKDAFTEGSFIHTLILEEHKVLTDYAVYPGLRKNGTAWEAFKAENKGKTLLSMAQVLRCEALVKEYKALPCAVNLLNDTLPEHNMVASILDVSVKARADAIKPKQYIVDVKTTSMPSDTDIFRQTIADYKYELSAALYCQIAYDTYGCLHDFYWVVLSKADKQCHVYKASTETLARGTAMVNQALVLYKKCKASGIWLAETPKVDYSTEDYEIEEI